VFVWREFFDVFVFVLVFVFLQVVSGWFKKSKRESNEEEVFLSS